MKIESTTKIAFRENSLTEYLIGKARFNHDKNDAYGYDEIIADGEETAVFMKIREMIVSGFKKGDEFIFGYFNNDFEGVEFSIKSELVCNELLEQMKTIFSDATCWSDVDY